MGGGFNRSLDQSATTSSQLACKPLTIMLNAWVRSPALEQVFAIDNEPEMQRHHRQRRLLQALVCAAHQVFQHNDPVVAVRGVEGGVEDAAVGEAAVEHDGLDFLVPE